MKLITVMLILLIIPIFSQAYYKEVPPGINAADFYVVDLEFQNKVKPEYFKNSVRFEWQQLSQLGEQSRGYLKKDLSSLRDDLRSLGLHPTKKIVIIGPGLKGRGQEGRVAYTLIKLGFKNVYISTRSKLISYGFQAQPVFPAVAKKTEAFKINQRTDLSIEKKEILDLLKKGKFLPCIDVRPDGFPAEVIVGTIQCKKISWRNFFNEDLQIKPEATTLLAGFEKTDRVILLSEAGLASAGVMLALRELGYNKAVIFEGGFSGLRALSDGLGLRKESSVKSIN